MYLELCSKTEALEFFKSEYENIFKDQDYEDTVIVAETNGKLVGALFWGRPEKGDEALVFCRGYSPVVIPEFKGLGVVKALASYIAEEASRCRYISVHVMGTVPEKGDIEEYERIVSSFLEKEIGEDDRHFESNLVFRDLNEVGLELVVRVSVEAYADVLDRKFSADWLRQDMPKWTECGDDNKLGRFDPSMWLVAYKNSDPVGAVTSGYIPEETVKRYQVDGPWFPLGFIWSTGIIPKYRRRGYGTILMRKAMALLADKGAKRIGLSVDGANIPGVRLYEKVGFKTTKLEDMLRMVGSALSGS